MSDSDESSVAEDIKDQQEVYNHSCMAYIQWTLQIADTLGHRPLSVIELLGCFDFCWYIWQCPLFSRSPLFGVSVNRESTVYYICLLNSFF